jgi:hypothetical protein
MEEFPLPQDFATLFKLQQVVDVAMNRLHKALETNNQNTILNGWVTTDRLVRFLLLHLPLLHCLPGGISREAWPTKRK